MIKGDARDIVGGLLVMVIGGTFAWNASYMSLGSGRLIGPGYFPLVTGLITVGLGIWITITAFWRSGRINEIAYRPLVSVIGSIVAFALLLPRVGLIPTLFVVVCVGATGSTSSQPKQVVVLAAGLAVACWVIFVKGLGLNMPAFRSPL
jgi:hypothetical protein